MRNTYAGRRVALALLDAGGPSYGLAIVQASGQRSGTVYPVLQRMFDAGWLDFTWEQADPATLGRPLRCYWSVTPLGRKHLEPLAERARAELTGYHPPAGLVQ
jgi:PadR family transcriptional regulator